MPGPPAAPALPGTTALPSPPGNVPSAPANNPSGLGTPAAPPGPPPPSVQIAAQYRAAQPEIGRLVEPPLDRLAERLSPASRDTLLAFKTVLSDPALAFDGGQLRQLLKHLGLHLEGRLAAGQGADAAETLKSALLELRHALQTGGGKSAQVEHLLQNLELQQLFNLRLAQQGALVWPLPLAFLEQGYLVVEERQQQRGDDDQQPPWQLALHLNLLSLGDLRIEFLHDTQGLFLRFVCANEEKAQFFAGFADELRQHITSVPLAGLSFTQGAEAPDKVLIRRVLGEGEGVLDARI